MCVLERGWLRQGRASYPDLFPHPSEDSRFVRRAEQVQPLLRQLRAAILGWADADLDWVLADRWGGLAGAGALTLIGVACQVLHDAATIGASVGFYRRDNERSVDRCFHRGQWVGQGSFHLAGGLCVGAAGCDRTGEVE
jgi:hypothetical protein